MSADRLQRARGEVALRFRRRGRATALARLRQVGCLKARFPRGGDDPKETVLLNTAGGIADGDLLNVAVALEPGARAVVTTQAAERAYRARPGAAPAVVRGAVTLGAGAALEWLPQELILFDGAALDRTLTVAMEADAVFLAVEAIVFGRAAMGEAMRRGMLHDRLVLHRAGALVLHDAIRLEGDIEAALAAPAGGGGAGAAATFWLAAADAESRLDALRAALGAVGSGLEAGASAWNGLLVARMVAANGALLRHAVVAGLAALRDGRPLPRVWRS